MKKLPSGIPVQWIADDQGVFTQRRTLPYGVSRGELEYMLWIGNQEGHHLVDTYLDGDGQQSFVPKTKTGFGGSENLADTEDNDQEVTAEEEEEEEDGPKYKKYKFDLVVKSKKLIYSFVGCYWYELTAL